jgi:hypothetical protein
MTVTLPPTVAVWYRPRAEFAAWRALGCNALLGYEADGGATLDQYLGDAHAAGYVVYLQSSAVRPQDYANPAVAGIVLSPDEPDGVGNASPAAMQALSAAVKASMAAAGVSKPIVVNFDGNRIPFRPEADYAEYCKAGDVIAFDYYPCNFGAGAAGIPHITDLAKKLTRLSGGKPVWACIETGDQLLSRQDWTQGNDATGTPLSPKMRGPTADEFRAEVQAALDGGVTGIVYFPDQIGAGWVGFDGTTDDVREVMRSFVTAPGAVSAATGTPTPTVTPTATPTVTPTPTPPVIPAVTPLPWVWARDLKHGRWNLWKPGPRAGQQVLVKSVTDPAKVATLDRLAAE